MPVAIRSTAAWVTITSGAAVRMTGSSVKMVMIL